MANTKIPSELIADSSITAAKLADGTITTADIADSNVTTAKIADSNVTTAKIGDAQVTTAKITDANVTTGKIADDAVTTAKMASNSVTSDTIASGITLAGATALGSTLAVTGVISPTTHIDMPDNAKLLLGTGDDLQIYHDGTYSSVQHTLGSGSLLLRSGAVSITNSAADETMASFASGGAVILRYSNSAKLATASGGVTVTGTLTATTLAGTLSTAAQTNITSVGTLSALTVDDITINGSTISDSGDMTLDVAGDIILDADSGVWRFKDAGTTIFQVARDSNSYCNLYSGISNMAMRFQGNDGGTAITALTLDMSDAGAATFNAGVTATGLSITSNTPVINIIESDQSNKQYQIGSFGSAYAINDASASQFRYVLDTNGNHIFNEGGVDADFRVESNGNAGMLFVDGGNDRLGIGTTSPAKLVHIVGTADNGLLEGIQIDNTDHASGETGQSVAINLRLSRAGTMRDAGRITVGKDDDWDNNAATDSHMTFKTMLSNTLTEHMRIDSSGNVGIGTTAVGNALTVSDATNISMSAGGAGQLRIEGNGYSGAIALDANAMHIYQNSSAREIVMGNNETEQFRIASNGYLIAQSASQVRLVLGSTGNATNNTSNWIRGVGTSLGLNAAGGEIAFEIGGSAKMTINNAGQIIANSLGTTTPTFSFINDPNTGMSRPTTDALNFCTAGSEKMRIISDGKVGIGTTSPNAKLELNVPTGDGLLIKSADVSTIKMKGSGGVTDWGFATTNLAAGDFGIYASNSAGGDPITAGTARMYFKSDGKVGIGTTAPAYPLHVYGANYALKIESSTGFGNMGSNNTAYFHFAGNRTFYFDNRCEASGGFHTYSDERLKENILAIPTALDKVALMNGVTFTWKDAAKRGGNDTGKQFGVIAQNMSTVDSELPSLSVDPLALAGNEDIDEKYYTMDYTRLTPFFIEAIKELKTKLEAAEARIETLEG